MSFLKSFWARSVMAATVLLSLAGMANATLIYSGSMTLQSSDPVQLGRLSRNGVPTDWSGAVFPNEVNPATSYHYQTLTLDLDALEANYIFGQYLQITIDSTATTTFLSAYLNAYNPANKATNYLGDPGTSGNYFGTDPLFFQVLAGSGNDLVLVMNETNALNGALGLTANIMIEAFADSAYTDLTVPEPAVLPLILLGLLVARRASKQRRSASLDATAA